jgi:nucleoporin NDC1
MSKVEDKFESEVLGGRVVSATLWSVLLSSTWLLIASFLLVSLQSPLQPLSNLTAVIQLISAPSSWFYVLTFICSCGWLAIFHSKHFTTAPTIVKSWAGLLAECCCPQTLRTVGVFSLFSLLVSWCVIKLFTTQHSDLLSSCPRDPASYCFSETHLLLLEAGLFSGVCLGFRYQFYSASYLSFPIVYKEKSSQVKQLLKPVVIRSVLDSVQILKYFLILHLLAGQFFSKSVSRITDHSLSTFASYLDLALLLTAFLIVVILTVVSSTIIKVFNIYASQSIDFTLPDLLEALPSDNKLLGLLSLQRLALLADQSAKDRKTIFSLSQPGGHPHHWNTINKACLSRVDMISTSLTDLFNPRPATAAPAKVHQEPVVSSSPYIRRLAPTASRTRVEDLVPAPAPSPLAKLWDLVVQQLKELKSKPGISVLFKTLPHADILAALREAQEVIWAVDVLSRLVAKSITEDTYGVVQKDLPALLGSLLGLEQNLEKCRGVGQASRRVGAVHPDICLKQELRGAVRAAIYRIVVPFGDHLSAVPLSGEHTKKINSYQQFMEA